MCQLLPLLTTSSAGAILTFEMPHLSIKGLDIHYKEKGQGFPIVLIHGYSGNLQNWILQVRALVKRYRTISLDLRGHGRSAKPTQREDYSLELFAADVYDLLNSLAVPECYLVGHSMGGMVAQEFVLRHPEMVRALVLVDTAADVPQNFPWKERARLMELARTEGMEAVFDEMLQTQPLGSQVVGENPELIDIWRRQFLMTSLEGYLYCGEAIGSRRPLLEELAQIRVPTLIICGEADEPFLAPSQRMHQTIPGSELSIIASAGHTPTLENPLAFNEALLSFLARVDSERR
ncbi:MAG: alpha/beta fold hydrolase [Dehalococcoidia bacterium]|nr:MAG: alpha/beta fold hydrolase [Dehalococcoidia bacterium]